MPRDLPMQASTFFLRQLQEHGVSALEVNFFDDNLTPCLDMRFVDTTAAAKISQLLEQQTGSMPSSEDSLTLHLTEEAVNNLFTHLKLARHQADEAYFTSLLQQSQQMQINKVKTFALKQLAGFAVEDLAIVLHNNEHRLQLQFDKLEQAQSWRDNIAYYELDKNMWVSQDGLSLAINKAAVDKMCDLIAIPTYQQGKSLFDLLLAEHLTTQAVQQQTHGFYLTQVIQQFNDKMDADATIDMVLPRGQNRFKSPLLSLSVKACHSLHKQQLLHQWYGYHPAEKTKFLIPQNIAQYLFRNIELEKLGRVRQQDTYTALLKEYIHTLAKMAKKHNGAGNEVAETVTAIHTLLQEIPRANSLAEAGVKQAKANGLMEVLRLLGNGEDMKAAISQAKQAYPELTEKSALTFWKKSRVAELLEKLEHTSSQANNPSSLTFHKQSLLATLNAQFNHKLKEQTVSLSIGLDKQNRHFAPRLIIQTNQCTEQAALFFKQLNKDFNPQEHTGMTLGPSKAQELCKILGMEKQGFFNPQDTYAALIKEHVLMLAKQAKQQGHDKHDLAEITSAIGSLYNQKAASSSQTSQENIQLQINGLFALLTELAETTETQEAIKQIRASYPELATSLKGCLADKLLIMIANSTSSLSLGQ